MSAKKGAHNQRPSIVGLTKQHSDFNREFTLPCGLSGVVEVPTLEVYETVEVWFETKPSKEMLKILRFPVDHVVDHR